MEDLLNFAVGMWTIFFVFCKWASDSDFRRFLNIQHPDSNFTTEQRHMKQLPFLAVLNTASDRIITSVYRKSTLTWFLKNYNSFVPFTYKKGLIKTPINRTFRLNNTCDGFHLELEKLRVILQKKLIPI